MGSSSIVARTNSRSRFRPASSTFSRAAYSSTSSGRGSARKRRISSSGIPALAQERDPARSAELAPRVEAIAAVLVDTRRRQEPVLVVEAERLLGEPRDLREASDRGPLLGHR